MSHGTYAILLGIDDPFASDSDLKDEVQSSISTWAAAHFDDNNYFQEEVLFLRKDDRIVQLADKNDWRGRDEDFKYVEKNVPESQRFAWAHRRALDCVSNALGLFGLCKVDLGCEAASEKAAQEQFAALTFDQVVKKIHTLAPKELVRLYSKISGPRDSDNFNMEDYDRHSLSRGYELFREAHTCPFAFTGTPYQYRAFDLTQGCPLDDDSAIVLVDIHT